MTADRFDYKENFERFIQFFEGVREIWMFKNKTSGKNKAIINSRKKKKLHKKEYFLAQY